MSRIRMLVGAGVVASGLLFGAGTAEAFDAHGSARQVYATGLAPRARVHLLKGGRTVRSKRADGLGGVLFRGVRPGSRYRVRAVRGGETSGRLRVFSNRAAPRDKRVYDQSIPSSGYGYLTTRDGTKLAIDVHPPSDLTSAAPSLPGGITLPPPPSLPPVPGLPRRGQTPVGQTPVTRTPTLIEYSGYGYADPSGPQNGIAILANLMGFTVVDVNMRGTGCSGGAYDFFEPLQNLDGYDVIETVARQPWVAGGKVGMMGISYGGISQLFTAALRPPSLAAISPLSVIDSTQTTLYPGGILNTGFALNWAKERIHDAKPAGPHSGQAYAYKRIQQGDETCKADQALHGQAVDLLRKIRANSTYRPKVADPLSPVTFVHKIDVPTFMACQWTDEQTGGHCPTLAEHFTGTQRTWFTYTNGTHVDSLDPETFNRWYDFLSLYVAHQAPITRSAFIRAAAPVIYQAAMGIPGVTLPNDPIQSQPTYDAARTAFEQLKPIRVLFDNGAGGAQPGQPYPAFEQSFDRFPLPATRGRALYLSRKGALRARRPRRSGIDAFRWNARLRPPTDFTGDTAAGSGGLWTATPPYHWSQNPAGSALSYVTPPLKATTTVVGAGSLTAWVRSSKPRADLQATVTEVRPDGKETFVQGGWLRGDLRRLDRRKSKRLEPVLSLRKRDRARFPKGRFVKLTVPLYYQGHAYRAGSRIRVIVSAPNGDQPIWSFARTRPKRTARIAVAHSRSRPSRLTLPVVRGVSVTSGLPPCPGLRGEPCRDYQPLANRTVKR